MTGGVSAPVPADDPRMIAWNAYRATDEYLKTAGQAIGIKPMRSVDRESRRQRIDGSLWAAFIVGFEAGRQFNKRGLELPGQGDES